MTNYQVENRQWWVQRWLELLDSYRFKKRLERARNYAREGNVLSIEFEDSQVLAKVQGTELEPYQVSLSLDSFTDEDWEYIIETLSQKAIFSAQLLAGEMPGNIEEVFTSNGLSLFPFQLSEINSRCSCPDKANPCKHIGAVYYQLADRFSEDPFVLFQLRGRTKEQILDSLRQLRSCKIKAKKTEELSQKVIAFSQEKSPAKMAQTSLDLERFWQYDEPLDSSLVVIAPPTEGKTILDLLGTFPVAYEEAYELQQYLKQVYQKASQQAVMSALNRE
jgi:uncharacterized Zn finger protein